MNLLVKQPFLFFTSCFIIFLFLFIYSSAESHDNQTKFTCNFVQVCDDIGNGCELSAVRIIVTEKVIDFEKTLSTGERQFLLSLRDLDGLSLLTIGQSGKAKLSYHQDVGLPIGRAISYHGNCN